MSRSSTYIETKGRSATTKLMALQNALGLLLRPNGVHNVLKTPNGVIIEAAF